MASHEIQVISVLKWFEVLTEKASTLSLNSGYVKKLHLLFLAGDARIFLGRVLLPCVNHSQREKVFRGAAPPGTACQPHGERAAAVFPPHSKKRTGSKRGLEDSLEVAPTLQWPVATTHPVN